MIAAPAVRPKLDRERVAAGPMTTIPYLRWIAVSPSPILMGTMLLSIFMFSLSVTAKMMMRSMAVPSIWSMERLRVLTCFSSKKG